MTDIITFNSYGSNIKVNCQSEIDNIVIDRVIQGNILSSFNFTDIVYYITDANKIYYIDAVANTISIQDFNYDLTSIRLMKVYDGILFNNGINLLLFEPNGLMPLDVTPVATIDLTGLEVIDSQKYSTLMFSTTEQQYYIYETDLFSHILTEDSATIFVDSTYDYVGKFLNGYIMRHTTDGSAIYLKDGDNVGNKFKTASETPYIISFIDYLEVSDNGSFGILTSRASTYVSDGSNPLYLAVVYDPDILEVDSVCSPICFADKFYIIGLAPYKTGIFSIDIKTLTATEQLDVNQNPYTVSRALGQCKTDIKLNLAYHFGNNATGLGIYTINEYGIKITPWSNPSLISDHVSNGDVAFTFNVTASSRKVNEVYEVEVLRLTDNEINKVIVGFAPIVSRWTKFSNIVNNKVYATSNDLETEILMLDFSSTKANLRRMSNINSDIIACQNNLYFIQNNVTKPLTWLDIITNEMNTFDTYGDINTLHINWSYPVMQDVTSLGALVLLSDKPFNPSNRPTNSVKYIGSVDLTNPQSKINNAFVVGTLYNDTTTTSLVITGADPLVDCYYACVHLVDTNGYIYYVTGSTSNMQIGDNADPTAIPGCFSNVMPDQPMAGDVWYDKYDNVLKYYAQNQWNILMKTIVVKNEFPAANTSIIDGTMFYFPPENAFYIYTEQHWNKVTTFEDGYPTYDKTRLGTSEIPGPRLAKIETIKQLLGAPMVTVELTDSQLNMCIDLALAKVRQSSDIAYYIDYLAFTILPSQQTYLLNNPSDKSDRIVEIIKIHSYNGYGISGQDMYTQQLIYNYFMNPGGNVGNPFDIVSLHEFSSLTKDFAKLFASDIAFTWYENKRTLNIQKNVRQHLPVLLEAMLERTEQDLLTDRYVGNWIVWYATAIAKNMLNQIRGKYQNLPGANGGLSLNANELSAQADKEIEKLEADLRKYAYSVNSNLGNTAVFMY